MAPFDVLKKIHREVTRVVALVLVGLAFIVFSPPLALALNIPALSPWGLFLGGAFFVCAISHIMRRLLFPGHDLQLIAKKAINGENVGAGLVFLGMCIVLAAFIVMNGSVIRM